MNGPLLRRSIQLGPETVALRTDQPAIMDYLADFYRLTDAPVGAPTWTVDARLGPGGNMRPNPWGVRYRADRTRRVLSLRADSPQALAMTARKVVREALVAYCEQRRYVMLHASAIANADRVILVVGDKGSGKTTLALKAVLGSNYEYVSNDHLILYTEPGTSPESDRLVVTSLPTPIPVKIGTYLDLEHQLPTPWDDEGLDIDAFRAIPPAERYRHDQRVLYTYRRLGQDNPIQVRLGPAFGGRTVLVVLARYAVPGALIRRPIVACDPMTALNPHVRVDWPFNAALNTEHLPGSRRNPDAYAADADRLLAALIDRGVVLAWTHLGDPRPLLTYLGAHS